MQRKQVAIIGYGNRGKIYADYFLSHPEALEIIAVIEPSERKRAEARKRYSLKESALFSNLSSFLGAGLHCDLLINATMDKLHLETTAEALKFGYDVLLEKPIATNWEDVLALQETAKETGRRVYVCHVLHYVPFYRAAKELIRQGELGEIMSVEMDERVGIGHYLASYNRGKWRDEEEGGSSFLLAKSCHDIDCLLWLCEGRKVARVSSFGSRSHFVGSKAPDGASSRCDGCRHEGSCYYAAKHQSIDLGIRPYLVFEGADRPYDELSEEEKEKHLKESSFGECAYFGGKGLVDRQSVMLEFEDGAVATFSLAGGCVKEGRSLTIEGSRGEIKGDASTGKFVFTRLCYEKEGGVSREIDANALYQEEYGPHDGADYALLDDVLSSLDSQVPSSSAPTLEDSLASYQAVFFAERSRKSRAVEEVRS